MTVICFEGKPRTGKTLFMTYFTYNNYVKGHEVFSNYVLKFPEITNQPRPRIMSVEDMISIPFNDVDRQPKTLAIQEADKIFDSRRSGRSQNVLLSSLSGQSGKRNLDIFYDTQYFNRVDGALRMVTDIVITASVYTDSETRLPVAFEYTITDVYESMNNDYIPKKIVIPAPMLEPFYKMYDSYEVTRPTTKNKKMIDITGEEE